ncbi:glycosyltransferase [Priestia megaterium]|uniref:glycosyltransferase n=1 Tax=Priestia megaterium TaxID=1404 RepID=UPI00221E3BD4|nr:glycosyltransferase [Priestia megaterium]UYV54094.1 glycosyltransferase [Priestia megaterium]
MRFKPRITVVTVTYGDRWRYLKKNIDILKGIDLIEEIIVVDNGSSYNIKEKLIEYPNVTLINLGENQGSARGFKIGIQRFLKKKKTLDLKQQEKNWILLLDDDNYIKEINVDRMINCLSTSNVNCEAYVCIRNSRIDYYRNYRKAKYNGFLGFNLMKSKVIVNQLETYEMLPYSGILLSQRAIEKIGYPDENFYLYCDDYEYSFRLAKNNIVVKLLDFCLIEDMEESWNKKSSNFAVNIVNGDPLKVYYSVRNRIYFEKNNLTSNYFLYFCNLTLFLVYLMYRNIKSRNKMHLKSLQAIFRGILDGLRGKIGIHKKYVLK